MGHSPSGPLRDQAELRVSLFLLQGRTGHGRSFCPGQVSFYMFSPIPLIGKVLEKIKMDRARILRITPAWPRQHWYGTLTSLAVAPHPLVAIANPPGPSLSGPRSPPPPQPSSPPPHGVVAQWLGQDERTCSEGVQRVLLESRRPSTHQTCLAKWSRFSRWAADWGVSSVASPLQFILDYRLHRRAQGLAPSSVKVHLTAYRPSTCQFRVARYSLVP